VGRGGGNPESEREVNRNIEKINRSKPGRLRVMRDWKNAVDRYENGGRKFDGQHYTGWRSKLSPSKGDGFMREIDSKKRKILKKASKREREERGIRMEIKRFLRKKGQKRSRVGCNPPQAKCWGKAISYHNSKKKRGLYIGK